MIIALAGTDLLGAKQLVQDNRGKRLTPTRKKPTLKFHNLRENNLKCRYHIGRSTSRNRLESNTLCYGGEGMLGRGRDEPLG